MKIHFYIVNYNVVVSKFTCTIQNGFILFLSSLILSDMPSKMILSESTPFFFIISYFHCACAVNRPLQFQIVLNVFSL